jgi:hypothetical protein
VVGGRIEGRRGKETVVEEGTFEDGVDEEIEGVPDEKDAETAGGGGREDLAGETVGGVEDHEDG